MTPKSENTGRALTGKKVLAIALACFATVIAANLAMLIAATGTFPGLVVENSYVASQKWQAETDAQNALGWDVEVAFEDGLLAFVPSRNGTIVRELDLVATIGRPTRASDDLMLVLAQNPDGYAAPVDLAPGMWRIEIETRSGPAYRTSTTISVAEGS